ncbi:DUF4112 domain-containing protein [Haladaptatus sp. DYSN1]|uniref:DUF4112 domain-containing protein n=1 Tax=unclassified Haladaptatus TaxID=2622732 RepID=UPI002405BA8E|nr:DUF4112 domain-containing protein [Haladaptatus sp. DYSN1]
MRKTPAEQTEDTLDNLRSLSTLLDNSIRVPGTNYRIGLDPLVGMLPVVGDLPTTALSVYIVFEAASIGVPRPTLYRMVFNLVVDATVGSIPIIGDLFDAVWKANARNVALLEARHQDASGAVADERFLLLASAGLLLVLVVVAFAVVALVSLLVTRLGLL